MNIQHSLFIQSYRHGVYRCTDVQGPHFCVSTFFPILGCFHILLFLSFLFLSVLISKNEAARRRTWKKQVTIPRVDGRGRANGVILSASWARMRHGKRWPGRRAEATAERTGKGDNLWAHWWACLQSITTPSTLASLPFSAWCDWCHDTSTQEWERKERDDGEGADGGTDGRSTQNTCS